MLALEGVGLVGYFGYYERLSFDKMLLAVVQWWIDPVGSIREYRQEIIHAAQAENVPPELVATVLLAELRAYDYMDVLGDDDLTIRPEKHSIGIAQLRVDNVRNWKLNYPEAGISVAQTAEAHKIRKALMEPDSAIRLLAKAVRTFAENGYESNPGVPVDLSNWDALPDAQRETLALHFACAKDNVTGTLTTRGGLDGVGALRLIRDEGLLQ